MLIRLKKYYSDIIPKKIKKIILQYKYSFNPSFVVHNQTNYLAIRLYDASSNSMISLLFVWKHEINIQTINLTTYFNEADSILKVSDPKLFIMNGGLWGTFNTGYTYKKNNRIGLFEIEKANIKKYYFCDYVKRSYVEKNWAFYSINDELFSLYSINPLIILKAKSFNSNKVIFEEYYVNKDIQFRNHSIGTPLIKVNNEFLFIAHKKIYLNGKRLYLGRPFTFTHNSNVKLKAKNVFLIHSIKTLFGNTQKFNNNLISCTYFSGIDYQNNKIYLSYGINDVKWNIITINPNKLCH